MPRPLETPPVSRRAHTGAALGNLSLMADHHRRDLAVGQAGIRVQGNELSIQPQQLDAMALATIAVLQRIVPMNPQRGEAN